jgi:MraZ protein
MQGAGGPSLGGKFRGSFQHQLDDKGRVSLPAAFRREAADQRFVLVQPYPPALALYPEVEWAGVEARLSDMMAKGSAERMYVLKVMSTAVEVSPDAQGRILIPSRLQEAAGLQGSVVLVGAINKVELWAPDRLEEALESEAADFDRYSHQLFR